LGHILRHDAKNAGGNGSGEGILRLLSGLMARGNTSKSVYLMLLEKKRSVGRETIQKKEKKHGN